MSKALNTGGGGRSDPTKSTAVWRCHKRLSSYSYLKCEVCDKRTILRLRRGEDIAPLCAHHFSEETGVSEQVVKSAGNEEYHDC